MLRVLCPNSILYFGLEVFTPYNAGTFCQSICCLGAWTLRVSALLDGATRSLAAQPQTEMHAACLADEGKSKVVRTVPQIRAIINST